MVEHRFISAVTNSQISFMYADMKGEHFHRSSSQEEKKINFKSWFILLKDHCSWWVWVNPNKIIFRSAAYQSVELILDNTLSKIHCLLLANESTDENNA